jgi:hypothetical protein
MTIIEDYLRIVALLLPKGQRDDIVLTRIEMRESDLDRALTESMMAEGLFYIASGAALLALLTWIWQASPFGPFVRLDGLAAAVDLMEAQHTSDVVLAPLLTVVLICTGLGALGAIGQGLWLIVRAPGGERV